MGREVSHEADEASSGRHLSAVDCSEPGGLANQWTHAYPSALSRPLVRPDFRGFDRSLAVEAGDLVTQEK